MPELKNYVIGRGKVYVDNYVEGTQNLTGERYVGNTPGLSSNTTVQNLDHFSSEEGIRVKDDTVQLQIDRGGTLQIDNMTMENIAMMFGASVTTQQQGASSGASETFTVTSGRVYQLGQDDDNPNGLINVNNVVVTNNSGLHAQGVVTVGGQPTAADSMAIGGNSITFVSGAPSLHQVQIGPNITATAQALKAEINAYPALYLVRASGDGFAIDLTADQSGTGGNAITLAETVTSASFTVSGATLAGGSASGVITASGNYTVDLARARVTILDAPADITDGDTLEINYDILVGERRLVVDEENQIEVAMRFLADNAKGTNKDVYWPRVRLTPNGEFAFKADTWQTITFTMDVLQPLQTGWKRSYVTEAVS